MVALDVDRKLLERFNYQAMTIRCSERTRESAVCIRNYYAFLHRIMKAGNEAMLATFEEPTRDPDRLLIAHSGAEAQPLPAGDISGRPRCSRVHHRRRHCYHGQNAGGRPPGNHDLSQET